MYTKESLIKKWEEEAVLWGKAENDLKLHDRTRKLAHDRKTQLLYCIADIKLFNEDKKPSVAKVNKS